MKKRTTKTTVSSKRNRQALSGTQLAFMLLIDAISETRAEDELVRILQTNIKFNL